MALNSSALKTLIISECNSRGFDVGNKHSRMDVLAEAIAVAVVKHITANAVVPVSGGSSSGNYKVT